MASNRCVSLETRIAKYSRQYGRYATTWAFPGLERASALLMTLSCLEKPKQSLYQRQAALLQKVSA